jgi:hypothetical protein
MLQTSALWSVQPHILQTATSCADASMSNSLQPKSNSIPCNKFKRSQQPQYLNRPLAWPRNPQHVVRAATHRKSGYFARKLIKLREMDLLPLEIVTAMFPEFSNLQDANTLDVLTAITAARSNLDTILKETADLKLQSAWIIFQICTA